MVRGSVVDCSISPFVSAVDDAQRARRRRMTNHVTTPEIKVAPRMPPMTPPSIPLWFELLCEVEVDDDPDPDAVRVGEKMAVPVTSGKSERHKVCVWTRAKVPRTSYGFRCRDVPAIQATDL
jgi:hypothetical protein